MEPLEQSENEFHHFQIVNQEGNVPLSITVLLHVNSRATSAPSTLSPIGADDILALHDALRRFDGNFIRAFQAK